MKHLNIYTLDLINNIFNDFIEFHGDRLFGDDPSIVAGIALLKDIPVTIISQVRGKSIDEQIKCNFSMTRPEGYRKTLRLMRQAEKFRRPIICFIDTIGAYPSADSEARGQQNAISQNIISMLGLKVPIISIIVGNACSGGALALCESDRILMLEGASFTVISPRAYAEIVWKDTTKYTEAKKLLQISSKDLVDEGIVDLIINISANDHKQQSNVFDTIQMLIIKEIKTLQKQKIPKLLKERTKKFRNIGLI